MGLWGIEGFPSALPFVPLRNKPRKGRGFFLGMLRFQSYLWRPV